VATVSQVSGSAKQGEAIGQCFDAVKAGKRAAWVAMIDVDEFLYDTQGACLMDTLRGFQDDAAALAINW
jgi:hypothetical protein